MVSSSRTRLAWLLVLIVIGAGLAGEREILLRGLFGTGDFSARKSNMGASSSPGLMGLLRGLFLPRPGDTGTLKSSTSGTDNLGILIAC